VPEQGDDKLRRAREALAAARHQAGTRSAGSTSSAGREPAAGPKPPAAQSGPAAPAPGTARAGLPRRRSRDSDPELLGAAIEGLLTERGWELAAAAGSVFGRWAEIVGADLAGHTTPESLRDGELVIAADSTAWATQLRLLAAQLVRRLNAELGDGAVLRVKVRGPVAPARKPGEWRVRGSRGPRDTYG
jgi:predicted nucleic acid-binding Zn ribbon protein